MIFIASYLHLLPCTVVTEVSLASTFLTYLNYLPPTAFLPLQFTSNSSN